VGSAVVIDAELSSLSWNDPNIYACGYQSLDGFPGHLSGLFSPGMSHQDD
jgi:hypothetical protein